MRRREFNEQEQTPGHDLIAYAIKAIDFDADEQVLFTGDEQGYLQKWDLRIFLAKLQREKEDAEDKQRQKSNIGLKSTAFITAADAQQDIVYTVEDVRLVFNWLAHNDSINFVSWVHEPIGIVASCSFDCNVYMWG